ncbi:MAG: AMP-binding protein, partial [Bacteroidota bacterium]
MADSLTAPTTYAPPAAFAAHAHVSSQADYEATHQRSVDDNEAYWREQADRIDWFEPFQTVKNVSYDPKNVSIKWYEGGKLNASYNALDRHLATRGDQTALLFEPDDPSTQETRHLTYRDVYEHVCRLTNALRAMGVKKGDRVTVYLPMIPEAAYTMLACSRVGAIHSVVFAGFSPDSLATRILDCESDFVVTADQGRRGGRTVALKQNVDKALEQCPDVRHVLVVKNTGGDVAWNDAVDVWYHDAVDGQPAEAEPEVMDAEDPLFILYTSGSTGKPKGVLHTTGG